MVAIGLTIGVLSIQGAISEHIQACSSALQKTHLSAVVKPVRNIPDINIIDALIIPGGESTTVAQVSSQTGLLAAIKNRIQRDDLPILGTCAGCILLAKQLTTQNDSIHTLEAMNMQVERNAFGRQKESFEHPVLFADWTKPFPAVFIRAPRITKVWGGCTAVSMFKGNIIAAQQNRMIALSFHPELTTDPRIYNYFFRYIKE